MVKHPWPLLEISLSDFSQASHVKYKYRNEVIRHLFDQYIISQIQWLACKHLQEIEHCKLV